MSLVKLRLHKVPNIPFLQPFTVKRHLKHKIEVKGDISKYFPHPSLLFKLDKYRNSCSWRSAKNGLVLLKMLYFEGAI